MRYDDRPFLGNLLKWTFILGLWIVIIGGCVLAWYAQELPAIAKNANFQRKMSITVKARDGSVVARYGETQGRALSREDLPDHLVEAVLSIEDRRFYYHPGLDPLGLVRAIFVNTKEGKYVQGGSTITQQLAKNLFLSQERTFKRKIQEAMLAVWLEYELSKDEIIAAYLNRVYMGSGTYGVDAAARLYYHKDVKDLDLRESATLAGLLKAPSRYSPLNNPTLSRQRADLVISAMRDAGYLTEAEEKSLNTKLPTPPSKAKNAGSARYYADWVVDGLEDLIGTPQEDIIVETTFDPPIQKVAEESLIKNILENGKEKKITQGAVIVMRPDGAVLSMVGGVDYNISQFNRATQAKRQPGSSFKPIVYLAALERGWKPYDLVIDQPFTVGKYRPQNFGNKYYGEVPLDTALAFSLNTVAVQIAKIIGPDAIVDMGRRLGIITPLQPDLSLALGSNSLSMLEMATVNATLANGGASAFPYAIQKIISEKGTLYYERSDVKKSRQVVDSYYVNELSVMMQGVLERGTGQAARQPYPASGKTGTSQDSRDAWFNGFTAELVTCVWMGNDDNSPMAGVTGGSYPARVWRDVMSASRGRYVAVRHLGTSYRSPEGFGDLMTRILGEEEPAHQESYEQPPQVGAGYNPGYFEHYEQREDPVFTTPGSGNYNQ
ncbi:MAG: transglycosylase domain-containing protein [Alphaproteobacteria bacterium]